MPRLPRLKVAGEDGWYHLWNGVAGKRGEFPLADPVARNALINIVKYYSGIYFCHVAAFTVMGTHYHIVLRFEQSRALSRGQLKELAHKLYPRSKEKIAAWPERKWERLQVRLFDVSEFMRNINEVFARWYNRIYDRKGAFWADRFKSSVLGGAQAVLNAVLYVELNGVRAGLAECPEDYKGCSLYLREAGCDNWLLPLRELLCDERGSKKDLQAYLKEMCYHRGAVITKEGQKPIRPEILAQEKARGFAQRGIFRRKLRCFTDGLVLGTEAKVLEVLTRLRQGREKRYLRRKNAIKQLDGAFYSLREQRTHFVPT